MFTRAFSTEDKAVQFDFTFNIGPTGAIMVSTDVRWAYRSDDVWKISPRSLEGNIPLEHTFQTGDRVYGSLKGISFFDQSSTDNAAIWGDFNYRYGNQDLGHFEGVMVTFPRDFEGTDTVEADIVDEDEKTSELPAPLVTEDKAAASIQRMDEYKDLFSYIYVHGWPEVGALDKEIHYVWYPTDRFASLTPNLFAQLTALDEKDKRKAAVAAACDYVKQEAGTEGIFSGSLQSLSQPLAAFSAAYERCLALDRVDAAAIMEVTASFGKYDSAFLTTYLADPKYTRDLNRIWQCFLALVVLAGYRTGMLRILSLTIVFANLLEAIVLRKEEKYCDALLRAHIALPDPLFPLPPHEGMETARVKDGVSGIETFAIGDLQMVKQRLIRYEAGEIARIVNLMRGERKEVVRRKRKTTRTVEERATARDRAEENAETENNHNLRQEILNTMCDHMVKHQYEGFKTSYGPPTTATLDGSFTISLTPTPDKPGKEEKTRFAREIVTRAANRITDRVNEVRTVTTLDETEEMETSIYDNSTGTSNLVGVFRWVNKIYLADVVNYGNRLLLELMLKDPASHYEGGESDIAGEAVYEPLSPADLEVNSYQDLNAENFAELAARYQMRDMEPPPAAQRIVTTTLQNESEKQIPVPKGYLAGIATVSCALPPDMDSMEIQVVVGTKIFQFTAGGSKSMALSREDTDIPVVLPGQSKEQEAGNLVVTVEVVCELSGTALNQWQVRAYTDLMRAYEAVRNQYDRRIGLHGPKGRDKPDWSALERREIKRGCMNLLLDRYQDPAACVEVIGARVSPGQVFTHRLEGMFEWPEMSYTLHADWGDPNAGDGDGKGTQGDAHDWSRSGGEEDSFGYFLQAQIARVLLPVKPTFNLAVLYYLSSGTLWMGPLPLVPVHLQDITLINELERMPPNGEYTRTENSWEFSIPTTMQILEPNDSAGSVLPGSLLPERIETAVETPAS
ncbi:MAG: hypothetical protein QNK37_04870 [Acidobacteriota bacterium]|nr:hypothetical protein [Acidobacteriota bacterium]